MCKLQERDDIGRIELVQKLARENCQFLQADKKEQEKSEHVSPFSLGDAGLKGWEMFLPGCVVEGKNILNSCFVFFPPKVSSLVKMTAAHNSKPAIYNTGFIQEFFSINPVEIEEYM